MLTNIWQKFINIIENREKKNFDRDDYSNKFYLITIIKLLCANIINKSIVIDFSDNIKNILNGEWFKIRGFANIVEYDYFGWLNDEPFIDEIADIAKKMQHDLAAYDFNGEAAGDLFGPLLAQLADKERRLLLGQEFTPQWLAQRLVAQVMEMLPKGEPPRLIDMACGSGAFLVEALKQTMDRLGVSPDACDPETLRALMGCAVGFDIDPLAVLAAKLNWAVAMREYMGSLPGQFNIPVFHADSLLAAAPTTGVIPLDPEMGSIDLVLDDERMSMPIFLISPENRSLFDSITQRANVIAKEKAGKPAGEHPRRLTAELVGRVAAEANPGLEEGSVKELVDWCHDLIARLERLHRRGRNGIWPFLLRNSYRPGLLGAQFNAIVSNPPWMAMSKLADNPYKSVITARAERFGIRPAGSSSLHLELATVFLLDAVAKFLKPGAVFGVIMPETLLNGAHQHAFRSQRYLRSPDPVPLRVEGIWELPAATFKNKAIAVFGRKSEAGNPDPIAGRRLDGEAPGEACEYRLISRGGITAWASEAIPPSAESGVGKPIRFLEGADIMPRTLIFHKVKAQSNGKFSLSPISRQNDDLLYLVKDAKKYADFSLEASDIDGHFIFSCFLSHHLTPFLVGGPALALLPIKREAGCWAAMGEAELAAWGGPTKAAFDKIFKTQGMDASHCFYKLNFRNKLTPQSFHSVPDDRYLVLSGAGGGHPCAAFIQIGAIDKSRVIIDQTLYWHVADSLDEAVYTAALLNSRALEMRIKVFQPKGAQGERHIHKLPYAVTPPFEAGKQTHQNIVKLAGAIINRLEEAASFPENAKLKLPHLLSLPSRRTQIRTMINGFPESALYEAACERALGI